MTDEDRTVSRRVLNRTLFNLGYVHSIPASDAELRIALTKALLPVVGGGDGLWAAVELLQRPEDTNAHT